MRPEANSLPTWGCENVQPDQSVQKGCQTRREAGENLAKLRLVLEQLIDGSPLPAELKDHPLRGSFGGSRDCHVEPDWILIYTITKNDTHVCFERTGTHADLFR